MRRPSTKGDYNLKLGPVLVDFSSSLEIEANDNVNISEVNRRSDLIIRPSVQAHTFWQATRTNTLRLDLGMSYAKYLSNSVADSSSLLIAPDSQLSFDIFVGDFKINLHDRFSILQNPIDEGSLSNVVKFDRIQNSAGFSVLWDLNDIKLVFGYDHFTFHSLSRQFSYMDRSEDQFSFSASAALNSTTTVGFDLGATPVSYQEDFNNGGLSYNVGPFLEKQISNYLKVRVTGGYQGMTFNTGGGNGDSSDSSSYYADLNLAHRMNAYWTESLSLGHETRLGLATNFVEYTYLRYTASWQLNHKLSLSMNAFYEDANESGGSFSAEHSKRYGVGISTSYQINRKLSLNLRYGFTNKDSDLALRSYYQNVGAVCFTYDF